MTPWLAASVSPKVPPRSLLLILIHPLGPSVLAGQDGAAWTSWGAGWGQEDVGPSAQGQRSKGGGRVATGTRPHGGGCREACVGWEAPPPHRQHPGQGGGAEGTRHLRGQQDPRTAIFLSCTDPQEPVGCINAQMRCKTYPKGGLSLEGESAGPCLPPPRSTSWYLSNIQTILGFQNDAISVPV